MTGRTNKQLVFWGMLTILGLSSGCISIPRVGSAVSADDAEIAITRWPNTIFYVDGAGGGGPITDATPDVRRGLCSAGFVGDFRAFRWQSGLGALADQLMSSDAKRAHARRLAAEIRKTLEAQPSARISLLASSAGTAIAVFALEALGETDRVDSVVLMSSAMSSTYDLSSALRHVSGTLHVLTSQRDGLLKVVVPMVGCSDRGSDAAAGIDGFKLPPNASDEARTLYARVRQLPWREEFRRLGHDGGHTDCKTPKFVQHVVAPLLSEQAEATVASAR